MSGWLNIAYTPARTRISLPGPSSLPLLTPFLSSLHTELPLTHTHLASPFSSSHTPFFCGGEYVWPEALQTLHTSTPSNLKPFKLETLQTSIAPLTHTQFKLNKSSHVQKTADPHPPQHIAPLDRRAGDRGAGEGCHHHHHHHHHHLTSSLACDQRYSWVFAFFWMFGPLFT